MTASVPNGERTFIGSIAAAGSPESVTFADRYQYVTVTNTGTDVILVTSDGTTPSPSGASNTQVVPVGETRIIANELPLWFQSSRVIPKGVNANAAGSGASNPGAPAFVTPQASLAGQMANPGTNITLADAASAGIAFVIEAAG
jgi:hypothetical protein